MAEPNIKDFDVRNLTLREAATIYANEVANSEKVSHLTPLTVVELLVLTLYLRQYVWPERLQTNPDQH